MRAGLVCAVLVVGACKSGGGERAGSGATPTAPPTTAHASVPSVDVAGVLAVDDGPPPLLVIVDDARELTESEHELEMVVKVSAAATWSDLAKTDPTDGAKPATMDLALKLAQEGRALGRSPVEVFRAYDPNLIADYRAEQDDPPPPPPEDMPDDGKDESGGTGTAMALDEGKMGKKDSERAEGQYKMKTAGGREPIGERGHLIHAFDRMSDPDNNPSRVADVAGEVMADGKLDRQLLAIVATPRTNAQRLAKLVAAGGNAIVVSSRGAVRPLRVDFTPVRDTRLVGPVADRWIEVLVTSMRLAVEAVPDVPIAAADLAQLGAALAKARAARALDAIVPVDVLVGTDVDAQRLVDVVVALDRAGARMIGLGSAPQGVEAARRGHRNPTVAINAFHGEGAVDWAIVRDMLRAAKPKLLACYTTALAKTPDLRGDVSVSLYATPEGKVATVDASGASADVASCVGGTMKALTFPKAKGGGGARLHYVLAFRP